MSGSSTSAVRSTHSRELGARAVVVAVTRPGPGASASRGVDRDALRAAFASEVSSRLPAMTRAAESLLAHGALDAARELARHAHTLASGAVIVGEDLAAQHARACETSLTPYLDGGPQSVPSEAVRAVLDQLAPLTVLLAPWLTGGDEDGD